MAPGQRDLAIYRGDIYSHQLTFENNVRATSSAWTTRATGGMFVQNALLGWASTAAVNRVTIAPVTGTHWAAGSTISVYGIAAGT